MIRSRLRRSLVATVAALALLATACGGSDTTAVTQTDAVADNSGSASVEAEPVEAEPAESDSADEAADEPAISLVASTVDGGQIDFGSLEGQDVVLWFWAPW